MAIYRCISIGFWSDRKVLTKFSPEDKYFFMYLLTNDKTTLCGCYDLKLEDAAIDLGYNIETVETLLERMEAYHKVIRTTRIDEEYIEVLVLNWGKYNWNGSPKQVQAVQYGLEKVRTEEFRNHILDALGKVKKKKEPEEKEEPMIRITNPDMPKPHPTEEEVEKYVEEKGYGIYAKGFWFYCEKNGWKDASGKDIGDWKSYLDVCEAKGNFMKVVI